MLGFLCQPNLQLLNMAWGQPGRMRLLAVGTSYIAIEIPEGQHQIPEEHWLNRPIEKRFRGSRCKTKTGEKAEFMCNK